MSFQCAMFKLKTVSYFVWTFVVFLYQLKSQQCQWWSPFNAYEVFSVMTACPECICICVICVPIESTSIRGFHNGRTGYSILLSPSPRHRGTDVWGRPRFFYAFLDQFLWFFLEKRRRSQGVQTLYIHRSAQAAFLALSRLVSEEAQGTLGTRHTYSHHPELP